MALMPGVRHQLTTPGPPMVRYDIVCVHTIVGYAPAPAAHFSTHANGTIIQSRDTRHQSAANYQGNPRVIAIENEDHGTAFGSWSGSDVPPLTDQQITAIAHICAWAHQTHGVPLVACPSSRPGSRGIAYHRQGIDGNWAGYRYGGRISGGEQWSTSRGKVCPGDRRISQIPEIIKRARQIAGGEDDMSWDEKITAVHPTSGATSTTTAGSHLGRLAWRAVDLVHGQRMLREMVTELLAGSGDLTPEQVEAAAKRGAQAAMIDSADELAAAIADQLDHEIDVESVRIAMRDVFGSLDNQEG